MRSGLDMRLVHERNPMKSLKGLRERAQLSIREEAKRAGIPAYQWEGGGTGRRKAGHSDGSENRVDVQDGMVLDFPVSDQLVIVSKKYCILCANDV